MVSVEQRHRLSFSLSLLISNTHINNIMTKVSSFMLNTLSVCALQSNILLVTKPLSIRNNLLNKEYVCYLYESQF